MENEVFSLFFSTTGEYYLQKFSQKVWCEMEKEVFMDGKGGFSGWTNRFLVLFPPSREYYLQKFGQKVWCEMEKGGFLRWKGGFFTMVFPHRRVLPAEVRPKGMV